MINKKFLTGPFLRLYNKYAEDVLGHYSRYRADHNLPNMEKDEMEFLKINISGTVYQAFVEITAIEETHRGSKA